MSPTRRVVLVLPVLIALQAISTDLYLPALPSILADLEAGVTRLQLTLSLFLVAFATAQLAYGPLSDRYGRRPLLIAGTALYTVASVGCMTAHSIDMLILWRVVQAVGACSGVVLGRAVIRDVYAPQDAARVLSYIVTAMALAPAAGPILGGWLTIAFGWRSTFGALALFGGVALLGTFVLLPETNRLPDKRALHPRVLLANYLDLLRDRTYMARVAAAACGYSGIFAFISASPYLIIDVLGLSPDRFGMCFALAVLGWAAGTFTGARLGRRLGLQGLLAWGTGICLAAGLFGLVWAMTAPLSVPLLVVPMMLFMVGAGLTTPTAMTIAIAPFPDKAGVASALLGFVQLGAAALIGLVLSAAYDGSGRPLMATLALAGVGAVIARLIQQSEPTVASPGPSLPS